MEGCESCEPVRCIMLEGFNIKDQVKKQGVGMGWG